MKIKGEGRTRFGRFSMVAVPAAIASAGLGVAIIQGSIGATLASADAFTLESNSISSDSLAVAAGSVNDAATIYAQTGATTTADGVDITAAADLPGPLLTAIHAIDSSVTGIQLSISSSDPTVSLPNVILNAKTLSVTDPDDGPDGIAGTADDLASATDGTVANAASHAAAGMTNVNLGVTSAAAGIMDPSVAANNGKGNSAYDANAFALKAGASVLNNVQADAYAITLDGLALDDLSLSVGFKH